MSKTSHPSDERNAPLHVPVLAREVIQQLDLETGMTVVDGTVGAAGHSRLIQNAINPSGTLIGLDRDPMMLQLAAKQLSRENCYLHHGSYLNLNDALEELDLPTLESVDRILLDLGLSSDQLADNARGFSFHSSGSLDLRFDTTSGTPAWKLIQQLDASELTELLTEYGEERFSRKIASELTSHRKGNPIRTAEELADAVERAIPRRFQSTSKKHPATRVFQALRIAVNHELVHLGDALAGSLVSALKPGGRLAVITFHSLEDRIVKHAFRGESWHNLTKKPITATSNETRMNPRSRTAKLRTAMKK